MLYALCALYAVGGFLVGFLLTVLAFLILTRRAEQEAFRAFWG